jgi:HAD superfamily phosphatase (TIGR01668 family)
MIRLFTPDLRLQSVLELDLGRLRSLGLDALLLDIDCTLKRYREESLPPETAAWLEGLRAAGIGLCLVSNGRTRRISALAEPLGVPFACRALKPLPFVCRSMVRRLGFNRARTALVGDQVFADLMAGRLAGLFTILVQPLHPEEEPWFTRIKRPLERLVLRRLDGRP